MGCNMDAQENRAPVFVRDTEVLGTWWWWVDPKDYDDYLDFAAGNGVNEIYYHTLNFNNRVGSFIEQAGNRGIRVYLLLEGYEYIWDHSSFAGIMERFISYQNEAPEKRKFSGLHLDIEPQNHPDFPGNRRPFLQDYLDFVVWVCSGYRPQAGTIDFDIAWWFDTNVDYRGERTRLYRALITEADRVFIMSYKDTAEQTLEVSREEIEFARSLGKQIILGAETGPIDDEPEISFYGKGRLYFYEQLHKLHRLVDYDNYGISIHYISAWYSM